MKNLIQFIGIILLISTITSFCNKIPPHNEKTYTKQFEEFVRKVEEKGENYAKEQWEEKDQKFKKYSGSYFKKYKDELTSEEKDKINKLKGKYIGIKARYTTKEQFEKFQKTLKNKVSKMKGILEGFLPDSLD